MSSGAELIAAERQRQVESEGWTPDHDDEHDDGQLAEAASAYLTAGIRRWHRWPMEEIGVTSPRPIEWPWDEEWWKPSEDPIRNLVKAGALIAAEIDRQQRIGGDHADSG